MTTNRTWSDEQNAIFSWFESGKGNAVVRARAGTGKTTTILAGIDRAPEASILLCAFNKRIAEELTAKLQNPRAEAKTLHAVGFSIVRRYWEGVRVDSNRDADLTAKVCGQAPDEIIRLVTKLAVRAKETAPFGSQSDLEALAEDIECVPDAEWDDDGYDVQYVARMARRQMDASKIKDGRLSFADMLFVPVANGWVRPRFDLIVVDEAQDMNPTQLLLAIGSARGRVCIVGDDRQAIYGFRGADSRSLDRMKSELNAAEFGLATTYRCPQSIVEYAARLVPGYRAAATAPAGEILTTTPAGMIETAEPGDFILSRKNAPLASTCLSLLRAGKRARVQGKDIGAGLISLVKKLKAKSLPDFLAKLSKWEAREMKRAESRKNVEAAQALVTDKAETLAAIAEGLSGVAELLTRIETLFSDSGEGCIVCSSVHKAKGLEAERVYVLRGTLYASRDRAEEANIEYVAVTRAKTTLVWVDEPKDAPAPVAA